MRSLDEILADARDTPPFSNSTEGYAWMDNWCYTPCVHDVEFERNGEGFGCPLILAALLDKTPVEWLEQERLSLGNQYHCIEFRDEGDGPFEPEPVPDPPGQETLMPRDEYEGTRMLTGLGPVGVRTPEASPVRSRGRVVDRRTGRNVIRDVELVRVPPDGRL